MKKNVMMRVAAVLLVAVLLTTCAISATFAKYVTTGSDLTGTAQVAKWGVKIELPGKQGLFSNTYAENDPEYTISNNSVEASTSTKVDLVAPGTDGTLSNILVTGTPEVAVRVTYDATLTLDNWMVGDEEYCPLVFTVNDNTYRIGTAPDGNSKTDHYYNAIKDLKAGVEEAIASHGADYKPNTDLSAVNDDIKVSWAWAFEGNDNTKDTALGDIAVEKADADEVPTITLSIKTSITQID